MSLNNPDLWHALKHSTQRPFSTDALKHQLSGAPCLYATTVLRTQAWSPLAYQPSCPHFKCAPCMVSSTSISATAVAAHLCSALPTTLTPNPLLEHGALRKQPPTSPLELPSRQNLPCMTCHALQYVQRGERRAVCASVQPSAAMPRREGRRLVAA